MIKVLLVAPYNGLAETAKNMDIPADIQLDTTVANLEEGVIEAKRAKEVGYDIIISRGGTASLIQESVSIPVVHIDITGYDMLRVFTLISGVKTGVALVGFRNISEGAVTICEILEFDVKMVTIESSSEVRAKLEQLKEDGTAVVIGDVITVEVAQRLGLRGVLITSGREAIMNAIDEAKRIHHFFRRVNYRHHIYKQAFEQIPLPLVLVDEKGKVIEQNESFAKIDKANELVRAESLSRLIKRVIDYQQTQWEEIEFESRIYQLQGFPISNREKIVGIQLNASVNNRDGERVISVVNDPAHQPLIGDSEWIEQLEEKVDRAAATNEITRLVGERGTGKYTVAQQIHFKRFDHTAPIVEIQGSLFTRETLPYLKKIFNSLTSGTVIVKNTDLVTYDIKKELLYLLTDLSNQIKVITLQEDLRETDAITYYDDEIIFLPPLRERKKDILAFVDYFLTEMHMEKGSETVGVNEEAARYLLQYDWKGNLPELRSVVKQLSCLTRGYYIDVSDVKKVMNKDNLANESVESLTINGTLKEMEKQIIQQVLMEENQNQTKAAKRLGINRSTLWRKLRDE
ncbi:PrpR N-terminal domain-containing protein [Allobacillus sp. GCM10007491]|uniref:PrpR N-terminal domain-containing protein n=1 Tax=Allobacillus saliphilus TaxID=2912308 RepID=A0A941HTG2_9BACI|nr:PrpR N-terminal domain-containing protein [Allobacillus saliphilus]MBR7554393.1 PrpR N-terminal domain-containing protein [Allobacillus saliphilus]